MRSYLSGASALLLIFVTATIGRSADDAGAVIDKAIAALGDAEKLKKVNGEQWKTKGTFHGFGMKIPYIADYSYMKPNMMRFDMAMEFGGQKTTMSAASDGKVAWEKMGEDMRDMDKKKAEEFNRTIYTMFVSQITPLKEKEFTLTIVPGIKVDDKPTIGIKVTRKDQRNVTLYLDEKTHLLAKSETKAWDEFSKMEVTQEVFLNGWKDKNGLKVFDRLTIKRDGKLFLEEEFSDQKPLEKLDAKVFEKPQSK
ncbi:MAG: hypothetical protein K8T89_12840 [Planctomycetes bacterium]|nr:hypothetical protein [Planctomycetota bacterium]